MITKELVNAIFYYQDGNLFNKADRSSNSAKEKMAGHLSQAGYTNVSISNKLYYLHRLIFLYHYGFMPKFVDHIDGDKLNNRIENLREVNKSQNACNSKISKINLSGVKGVSFDKNNKKWQVYLTVNGKQKSFGRFYDFELAALVAHEARIKYHGEFARHG